MTHDALLSWNISAVEMPSIPGIPTSIRMMERSERLHQHPYLLR